VVLFRSVSSVFISPAGGGSVVGFWFPITRSPDEPIYRFFPNPIPVGRGSRITSRTRVAPPPSAVVLFRSVSSVFISPAAGGSVVGFWFPITRSPDEPIYRFFYPLPGSSQVGVGLRGSHPKPSQIGVGFSDLVSIGVGFIDFGVPINRSPDYRITRSRTVILYHLFAILSSKIRW
jgi:hypothetical protein